MFSASVLPTQGEYSVETVSVCESEQCWSDFQSLRFKILNGSIPWYTTSRCGKAFQTFCKKLRQDFTI